MFFLPENIGRKQRNEREISNEKKSDGPDGGGNLGSYPTRQIGK
jgi:hypothetical protein